MALTGSVTAVTLCIVLLSVVWEVHTQYLIVAHAGDYEDAASNDVNSLDNKVLYFRFPVRPIVKLKSKEKIPPPPKSEPPESIGKKALIPKEGNGQERDSSINPELPDEYGSYLDYPQEYSYDYGNFGDYSYQWPDEDENSAKNPSRSCPCEIYDELPRYRSGSKEKRGRNRCPCKKDG